MRIAIIALAGLVLFALVSSWIGMPRSEIAFLAGGYALSGAFIWWLLPIALASGASMTIRVGLARIRHGKPYDSKALRRACWAFRKNEDIRRLGQLAASESIPADLLTRVEKALPRLEVSAVRKFALLTSADVRLHDRRRDLSIHLIGSIHHR